MIIVKKLNKRDLESYAVLIEKELGYTHEEALSHLKRKKLDNILKLVVNGKPVGFTNFVCKGNSIYICDLDILKN